MDSIKYGLASTLAQTNRNSNEVRREIDAVAVQLSICQAVIEALLKIQLGLVIRCSMQMPGPKNNFSPHLRSRIIIVTLVTWPTVHKRPREGTHHRERGTRGPGPALPSPSLSLSVWALYLSVCARALVHCGPSD